MKARHCRGAVSLGLALLLAAQQAWADDSSQKGQRAINPVPPRAAFTLNLQGCPIKLDSQLGGYVDFSDSNNPRVGYYQSGDFNWKGKKFGLAIDFKCIQEPAAERCPDELDLKVDDPRTLREMHVVRYKKINPVYEGSVVAYNFTTMNPPLERWLQFCLGDGQRTLVGRSIVGNEPRAFTEKALRILASIRFTDEQEPKK